MSRPGIEAVIFDWGGTLTRWHDVDFHAESVALAQAVITTPTPDDDHHAHAARLHRAGEVIWGRSRDHQQSSTIADLFTEAGLDHDPELLQAYYDFWEPHTQTDPDVAPCGRRCASRGSRSACCPTRSGRAPGTRASFERDGVRHLIDGDVYTSEIPWTKPSPRAFGAAMEAVGATDPARCVYVGDRLFDDVWGAQNAGLRAIHVPHSAIPSSRSATPRAPRTPWSRGSRRSPRSFAPGA